WLILKREFSTRVRKKSFIIMTILGPVLSSALFILPAYLATLPDDTRVITVLDEPGLMNYDKGKENIQFRYLPPQKFDLEEAREFFKKTDDYALLYIPGSSNNDPDIMANGTMLFSKGDVNLGVEAYVQNQLDKFLQAEKL